MMLAFLSLAFAPMSEGLQSPTGPRLSPLRYAPTDEVAVTQDFISTIEVLPPPLVPPPPLATPPLRRSSSPTRRTIPWTIAEQEAEPLQGDETINRAWGSVYQSTDPNDAECSYFCEDIEGVIPPDLKGILYRNGPGNFERGGQRFNHILDGDGFIASFAFLDGNVKYTGKFIETEGYVQEKENDKVMRRNVFGTEPKDANVLDKAFDIQIKNVANHHVVEWGERVFALWEGGRAHELDPVTLETLSNVDGGPAAGLTGDHVASATIDEGGFVDKMMDMVPAFTNHPHEVDEDTFVAFRHCLNIPKEELKLEFVEYDREWNEKQVVKHTLPGVPVCPHDFTVTDDYYVFFETRFVELDQLPFILGLKTLDQIMAFDIKKASVLHLVPRDPSSGKKPLRIEGSPYLNLHVFQNPTVVDNKLTFYNHGWDLTDERFFPKDKDEIKFFEQWDGFYPDLQNSPPGRLWRTVVDLEGDGAMMSHEQVVPGMCMEESVVDLKYPNFIYGTSANADNVPMPPTGYVRANVEDDTAQFWWADRNCFVGEPIAVTKRNGEEGSWLLGLEYDAGTKERTSVIVLDSEKFEEGPVCRVSLKHSITYGTHGSFAEDISVVEDMFKEL